MVDNSFSWNNPFSVKRVESVGVMRPILCTEAIAESDLSERKRFRGNN